MADSIGSSMQNQKKGRTCFQCFRNAISLVPPGVKPPSWKILWLIFISLFSSAFTLTFLFPFLPEMILTFGYTEEEKGTYVGLVASSVFAGRAAGSFFWGWLADLKGRRLVLLITIFLNGIFSFLFGFVDDLSYAMLLRFLAGLVNGTVGVAKSVLYDISDNTNQAFSMSIISIAWGSGLILGPMVGGYLAVPATKYPDVFPSQGFFADFPFVLPSFCCLLVCGVAFVIVFFKFEEPKPVLNESFEVEATVNEMGPGKVDSCADNKLHTSEPLLNKLHSHHNPSQSSQSFSPKIHMSIENLHCESEVLYYYGHLQSETDHTSCPSEDKIVSKSMQNLGPVTKVHLNEDTDLLPVARKRSLSQGHATHQKEARNVNGDLTVHPDVLKKQNKVSVDTSETCERHATDSNHKSLLAKDSVSCEEHLKGDAVLTISENDVKADSVQKRSILSSCWHSLRHSSFIQLLSLPEIRSCLALYAVMSFAIIGYDDVFTVFASTATEYDGLGLSTDEIGIALGAVSIPLMLIQIKIYPLLVSKFGIKRTYLINMCTIFVLIQLIPLIHLLVDQKAWMWVCLVLLSLPMRVSMNSCFAGTSLLINNSVTVDMAGKANGLGMTASAIARMVC